MVLPHRIELWTSPLPRECSEQAKTLISNEIEMPARARVSNSCPQMAISVRQPWAWLIVNGLKDIENRDWATRYRGAVLIHAGKGMTRDEYEDCLDTCRVVSRVQPFPSGTILPAFSVLERGGIVGQATITDCVTGSPSPWFFGRYGFVLTGQRALPFRPYKGALGFFPVPA